MPGHTPSSTKFDSFDQMSLPLGRAFESRTPAKPKLTSKIHNLLTLNPRICALAVILHKIDEKMDKTSQGNILNRQRNGPFSHWSPNGF